MNVRFSGSPKVHKLKVESVGPHLVRLKPPFPEEILTTGFEVLTEKGTVYGKYKAFNTIYRELEDGTVILSNDGSVWTPPPEPVPELEPEPIPEPEPPTLEEVRAMKVQEVDAACEQIIAEGVTVELSGGAEHFPLTDKEQLALVRLQVQLTAGADKLLYHAEGKPFRYYSAEELHTIITVATERMDYHRMYCDSLHTWIAGAKTAEDVHKIYYGTEIPKRYQSKPLKDYLARIMAEAKEAVETQ